MQNQCRARGWNLWDSLGEGMDSSELSVSGTEITFSPKLLGHHISVSPLARDDLQDHFGIILEFLTHSLSFPTVFQAGVNYPRPSQKPGQA